MDKILLLVVVLLVFPSVLLATTCDQTKGLNDFNPDCKDKKLPYCRLTDDSDLANFIYSCVACKSSCDCSLGSYCSSDPKQIGKCVHFGKAGKSCRPLTQTQLLDRSYPEDWKCAYIYVTDTNTTVVDQAGVCIDQTCKDCDYIDKNKGLPECGVADGLGATRTCIYPGNLHDPHTKTWNSKVYYENPVAVWQGVYYPFFMILFAVQIAILVLQVLRWRSGGGGGGFSLSKSSGSKETEMSSKKHATVPQPSSNHSSITPAYEQPPEKKDPPPYEGGGGNGSRPSSSQIQYLKEEPS